MKASTANFIAYDLRPAKQTERRILLDFLRCASEAGINISDCRYIGMGGTTFYDFHLLHRFLGVDKMTSLERDPDLVKRAKFNCPYDFIKVEQRTVADFLVGDVDKTPTIYWLDYDNGISSDITADIVSLGSSMTVGGFAFVTVYAKPPGILVKQSIEQRFDFFRQYLGDFAIDLIADDLTNAKFANSIYRVLVTAFNNAFAARTDGQFYLLFRVQYKDSSPMITVGGCFCVAGQEAEFVQRMNSDLPFLVENEVYQIENLCLTERERTIFDLAVTNSNLNSPEADTLRSLGFTPKEFEAYGDLVRFLPRYHESII